MDKPRFANLDALHAAIASIATRAKRLDADIQDAAMGCLEHLDQHGDVGPVNRLYDALGAGHRKTALGQWMLKFGKVQPNMDPQTKKVRPFAFKADKATDLVGAAEKPWYNFAPDKAVDEYFDLQAMMRSVISKASGKKMAAGTLAALKEAAKACGVPAEFKVAPVIVAEQASLTS